MKLEIQEAIKLINEGQTESGIEQLKKITEAADHETNYQIAEIYHQLGLVDLAKEIIEELISFYPDESELAMFMAELLIDLDEEDQAIEILLEINENDPIFVRAQLLLADLYQLQGLEEVAEQKLLKAKSKLPNEPVVLFGLGEFYLSRGDYLKSIPYYKQVLPHQEDLNGTNIALRLAEAFSASGAFEEAITHYEDGVKNEATIDEYFGYGYTAFQLRLFKVAIKQFEKVIEMDESYSSLYPYLAEAYAEEGQSHQAMQIIKKGLEIDEYNEALYVEGARISLNSGNFDAGEQYLRKVLAISPTNFEGANLLASQLKKQARWNELEELIVYLKSHGEDDPLYDWFLATAKRELDDYDEALKLYEQLSITLSHDSDFMEEYGQVLLEDGYHQKAKEILTKAYQLDVTKLHIKEILFDLDDQL
jgi:tetratricopeptide (TPR) repeat protein